MSHDCCPHKPIKNSLDRWTEVHWHIHQMEDNFHYPEPFRYSTNSFIRSIKEIPQILSMELQNQPEYKTVFRPEIESLRQDKLFALLSKKRDFIVHHGVLQLHSKGMVGTTEGRGFKIGMSYPVHPFESSDEAYVRFKEFCKKETIIRSAFGPDCDSWPCIERTWRLPEFPEEDVMEVCIHAWQAAGVVLSKIVENFGGEQLDLELRCRHDLKKIQLKVFDPQDFFRDVDGTDRE